MPSSTEIDPFFQKLIELDQPQEIPDELSLEKPLDEDGNPYGHLKTYIEGDDSAKCWMDAAGLFDYYKKES